MTLDNLKAIIAAGDFHHATYRTDFARGLHIYTKSNARGWGFGYAGMISEHSPECDEAYKLVRSSGVYEGSYK